MRVTLRPSLPRYRLALHCPRLVRQFAHWYNSLPATAACLTLPVHHIQVKPAGTSSASSGPNNLENTCNLRRLRLVHQCMANELARVIAPPMCMLLLLQDCSFLTSARHLQLTYDLQQYPKQSRGGMCEAAASVHGTALCDIVDRLWGFEDVMFDLLWVYLVFGASCASLLTLTAKHSPPPSSFYTSITPTCNAPAAETASTPNSLRYPPVSPSWRDRGIDNWPTWTP